MKTRFSILALMLAFWVCIFLLAWLETGCSHFSLPKAGKPFKVATVAGTLVEQSPQTEQPAKIATTKEESRTVIPAGSDVTFNEKLSVLTAHVNKDLIVSHSVVTETIQAPLPIQPPSPSVLLSAQTKADGEARLWYISAGLGILALLAFYSQHIKAGIFLVIGAIGFPLLSTIVSFLAGYALLIVSISGACCLVWAWYSVRHSHPAFLAELKAKVSLVENKIEAVVKT